MSEPLHPSIELLTPPASPPVAPVDPRDRAATTRRIEGVLLAIGALQRGHFLLTSGRHGEQVLDRLPLAQHPAVTAEIAQVLAVQSLELVTALGGDVDLVVGPSAGVAGLAFELGRLLGVRDLVAD